MERKEPYHAGSTAVPATEANYPRTDTASARKCVGCAYFLPIEDWSYRMGLCLNKKRTHHEHALGGCLFACEHFTTDFALQPLEAMTEEQVNDALRAHGYDPNAVGKRMQEAADLALKAAERDMLDKWLKQAFGSLDTGDTLQERVENVVKHYATQMGRWAGG